MDQNHAGLMLLQHALCQPLPKAPGAWAECQTQAVPPGPVLFDAHLNPFQCRQVAVSSLPSVHAHPLAWLH